PHQRFALSSATGVTNYQPSTISSGIFVKDSRHVLLETANTYDAFGRATEVADGAGHITKYTFGGTNSAFLTQITRQKDGTGSIDLLNKFSYSSKGYLSSIEDEGGARKEFAYDSFGRLRYLRDDASVNTQRFDY